MKNSQGWATIWRKIREIWAHISSELPFVGIVLLLMVAALVWGLHEVDVRFEQNGVEDAWEALLLSRGAIEVSLGNLLSRTLVGLIRALLLPALATVVMLSAGITRVAGALSADIRVRSCHVSWILLLLGVTVLVLDVLF